MPPSGACCVDGWGGMIGLGGPVATGMPLFESWSCRRRRRSGNVFGCGSEWSAAEAASPGAPENPGAASIGSSAAGGRPCPKEMAGGGRRMLGPRGLLPARILPRGYLS